MGQLPRLIANQQARKAAGERNTCRLAIEIDSDTYLKFEKDTNRIRSYVLQKIDTVSKVFERETNTQLVVVAIHIWKDTEPDPYRGESSMYTLFSIFYNAWNNQFKYPSYDKRLYLVSKPVTGASGIGEIGGTTAVSILYTNTITHELGHTFGSPHTHNCSWPGGPIDYCSPSEGDCYTGSLQNIRGTIMSYCGYGSPSIRFHPLCQALITDHATKNLAKLAVPVASPTFPAQLTLSGTPFLYWDGVALAEGYDLEVAEDESFTKLVVRSATPVNGYLLDKLRLGQSYYVRARTTNSFGISPWSNTCRLQTNGIDGIAAPKLLWPASNQFFLNWDKRFQVESVTNATSYELQLASGSDIFSDDLFDYPAYTATESQPVFIVNTTLGGIFWWRVRAVVNGKKGPWSSLRRITINIVDVLHVGFDDANRVPLTFPYYFYTQSYRTTVQLTLATDSLFAKPVRTQTFRNGLAFNGILDKLTPNTQYYLKFEETVIDSTQNQVEMVSRSVKQFRTVSGSPSPQWTFVNSGTHAGWPQGESIQEVIPTQKAVWTVTRNGPARIDQDDVTLRIYDFSSTKGKIGNIGTLISKDASENLWVTNQLSAFPSSPGSSPPVNQIGKLVDQTGELMERTSFALNGNFPSSFSADPGWFFTSNGIYEQKAGQLTAFYNFPSDQYILDKVTRPGFIWLIVLNPVTNINELIRLSTADRSIQTFTATNTPQLEPYFRDLELDAAGNVWVTQYNSWSTYASLAKFDNQTWTNFKSPAVPFTKAIKLTSDQAGNVYVLDDNSQHSLYKFDGSTWTKLTDVFFASSQTNMVVDNTGNIWFAGEFQLARFLPCAGLVAPKLSALQRTIEVGESVTLQASGCSDVLWSWTSASETVNNRLIRGTNQLVVKPEATTTYRSRCSVGGCSGADTSLIVTVLPKLTLARTNKNAYCQGDSLTASYGLQGKIETTNRFSVILKSGTQTTAIPATARGSDVSVVIPNTVLPGRYVLYLETTQPAVRTRDSVQISVSAQPTAELSSNKLAFPPGDSAYVSVALTGLAPWRFTRWDSQIIQTTASLYTYVLKATQPTNYSVSITGLSDAHCAVGTVKNSLVVSALILANEPLSADGISVYPNPAVNQLTIELKTGVAPLSRLQLYDRQGREILQKVPVTNRSRREEWTINGLATGQYILRIETQDGRSASWKVIKQ
ncbi:hypothetical protein GCM10028774_64740 [Spirosoma jeollabukense]